MLYAFNSSGTKIADYTYDAWGNESTEDASTWEKDNPVRYNGQYYDAESGLIYLRNRYYDSDMGRFITEDLIKDGLNWYAYCAGDPVNVWDPSGLKIFISNKNPSEQHEILEYLDTLTRDELDVDEEEYVYIKTWNPNAEDRSVGTELIYQLMNNDNICTIEKGTENGTGWGNGNKEAASQPGGVSTIVTINTEKRNNAITTNGKEEIPIQISLGHELLHAWRSMNGIRIPKKDDFDKGYYIGDTEDSGWAWQEELDTVGINYYYNKPSYRRNNYRSSSTYKTSKANEGYFTENALRRENGFAERVRY